MVDSHIAGSPKIDNDGCQADSEFKYILNLVRENLTLLREDLAKYRELKAKKQSTDLSVWQAQLKDLDAKNKMRAILIRSG